MTVHILVRLIGIPLDHNIAVHAGAAQQTEAGQARRASAGQGLEPLQRLSIKIHALRYRVVAWSVEREKHDVLPVKPRVEVLQVPQTADEQSSADQQEK